MIILSKKKKSTIKIHWTSKIFFIVTSWAIAELVLMPSVQNVYVLYTLVRFLRWLRNLRCFCNSCSYRTIAIYFGLKLNHVALLHHKYLEWIMLAKITRKHFDEREIYFLSFFFLNCYFFFQFLLPYKGAIHQQHHLLMENYIPVQSTSFHSLL